MNLYNLHKFNIEQDQLLLLLLHYDNVWYYIMTLKGRDFYSNYTGEFPTLLLGWLRLLYLVRVCLWLDQYLWEGGGRLVTVANTIVTWIRISRSLSFNIDQGCGKSGAGTAGFVNCGSGGGMSPRLCGHRCCWVLWSKQLSHDPFLLLRDVRYLRSLNN